MDLEEIAKILHSHLDGLEELINNAKYYCEDYKYDDQVLDDILELKDESGATWYDSGATKLVLAYADLPHYVVKIPFVGCKVYDCDENDNYDLVNDASFDYNFADASHGELNLEHSWDYCEAEEKIYQKASNHLKNLFVETIYVCSIGGHPIYVSPEMVDEFYWEDADNASEESIKLAKKMCSAKKNFFLADEIVSVIIEQQGKEIAQEMMKFIAQYSLNDFHTNNLMYDSDGILKFIDYAGYNE